MKEIGIRSIVDGKTKGSAVVSPVSISFLGDVDPETAREREDLEALARNEDLAKRMEIDGVSEDLLEKFLSDIDSIEF